MAGVRQAARITREASYGVFNTLAASTDKATIILSNDNPVTLQMKPRIWEIANAAYDGRPIRQGTEQLETAGKLQTLCYPSQCKLLLELATKLSTGSCRGIDSFTLDYLYIMEDTGCTVAYDRFLGCMIAQADLNSNNNGQGVLAMLDLDIVAQKRIDITVTDFAEPVAADYPDQDPFVFQDSTGTLKIGSIITNYSSLNLSIKNTLAQRWDELKYPYRTKWRSRMVTLAVNLLQKNNTFRAAAEAQTALDVEYNYNDGTNNLKIDLNTRNYIDPRSVTRPLQGDFEESFTLKNKIDPAVGSDIVLTYPT